VRESDSVLEMLTPLVSASFFTYRARPHCAAWLFPAIW